MTSAHSARRGVATAAGGLVVIGAGAAAGVIIADMHATYADQAALEAASSVAAQPEELDPVRPVVVTIVEERHITPEPVIVHKKVYRTVVVDGAPQKAPRQTTQRRTTTGSTSKSATAPRPSTPRTVVAPAPKAPAPSPAKATSGTKSKTS